MRLFLPSRLADFLDRLLYLLCRLRVESVRPDLTLRCDFRLLRADGLGVLTDGLCPVLTQFLAFNQSLSASGWLCLSLNTCKPRSRQTCIRSAKVVNFGRGLSVSDTFSLLSFLTDSFEFCSAASCSLSRSILSFSACSFPLSLGNFPLRRSVIVYITMF